MRSYFKPGVWNVICQVCGRKVKSDQIKKRWDGILVCNEDFEVRHPLDFLRAINDDSSVPFTNPEPSEYTYISVSFLSDGRADIGGADLAMAGVSSEEDE